jgi:hypothetical protein
LILRFMKSVTKSVSLSTEKSSSTKKIISYKYNLILNLKFKSK